MKLFVLILIFTFTITPFDVMAVPASLEKIQEIELKSLAASADSQARVDKLEETRKKLRAEYRAALAQIESLEKYNRQMSKLIQAQRREKIEIRKQIKQAGTIDRHIAPLMNKMLNGLNRFIELDLPFLLSVRKQRVANLRALMGEAHITPAEKFRKILEAYEIEMEYGRTIETWQAVLPQQERTVDFIRFGRLSWVYQTFDHEQTALWDANKARWLELSGWGGSVRQAIKVAAEQAPPALLFVPIKEGKK